MALDAQTKIAVIGAGTMGSGIAEVAARHGHRVVVIDQQSDALARSQAAIEKNLEGQVAKGRLTPEARDEVRARLSWQGDLLAVADAGLVIEAIVERPDAKAQLFAHWRRSSRRTQSSRRTPRPCQSRTSQARSRSRRALSDCISSIPCR